MGFIPKIKQYRGFLGLRYHQHSSVKKVSGHGVGVYWKFYGGLRGPWAMAMICLSKETVEILKRSPFAKAPRVASLG